MSILVARSQMSEESTNYTDLYIFDDEQKAVEWVEVQNRLGLGTFEIVRNIRTNPTPPDIERVYHCFYNFRYPCEMFNAVGRESWRIKGVRSISCGLIDRGTTVEFWSTKGLDEINKLLQNWFKANKLEKIIKDVINHQ